MPLIDLLPWTTALTTSSSAVEFAWNTTKPSREFKWHSCYDGYKCAVLQVPMDWQGTSSNANQTVELAVVKIEATVPLTSPQYGGAVVVNPGGPAGSGVGFALSSGYGVRTILSAGPDADPVTAKHFDIISFDPRGVGKSTPSVSCSVGQARDWAYITARNEHGALDTSNKSFDWFWDADRAAAKACSERFASQGIGKHMNTVTVAWDLVEIVEQHGKWRHAEARRLLQSTRIKDSTGVLARTAYKPGEEMIQYWGISYGTALGGILSAMYPERIHRALLDGNLGLTDYMAGNLTTLVADTDKILIKLAERCYEAGISQCALWNEGGPENIISTINDVLSDLERGPAATAGVDSEEVQALTYTTLRKFIADDLYKPLSTFPDLALVLHLLSVQDTKALSSKAGPRGWDLTLQDASNAIMCTDFPPLNMINGVRTASLLLQCSASNTRPNWQYTSDFHSVTAHPILFAGNTLDPVTPIRNAISNAAHFEGAGVLHQDSEGHGTTHGISLCSMEAIRDYFQTGRLPGVVGGVQGWGGVGKFCPVDRKIFDGYKITGPVPPLPTGKTDRVLWEALIGLQRKTKIELFRHENHYDYEYLW